MPVGSQYLLFRLPLSYSSGQLCLYLWLIARLELRVCSEAAHGAGGYLHRYSDGGFRLHFTYLLLRDIEFLSPLSIACYRCYLPPGLISIDGHRDNLGPWSYQYLGLSL